MIGTNMSGKWCCGYQVYIDRFGNEYRRKVDTDGNGQTTFAAWDSLALNSNMQNLIKSTEVSVTTTSNNYVSPYGFYGNADIPFSTIPSAATIIGAVITGGNATYGSITVQKSSSAWTVHMFTGREVSGATVKVNYHL